MMEQAIASARVLVVEDDEAIADVLRRSLRAEGHEVRSAGDGAEALTAAEQFSPDLVVLDLGLPRLDGMEVCRRLRAESDVPILILTARTETEDRVKGLDTGADDYLPKPFSLQELLARVRALIRRGAGGRPRPAVLAVGDLTLNPARHEVARGGAGIGLTPTEFALLEYLMRNADDVLTRSSLIEHVWDFAFDGDPRIINVYIRSLRDKIDRPFGRASLETVRGIGYRIRDDSLGQPAD
jgi:two-component system, OmpR family, response regulator